MGNDIQLIEIIIYGAVAVFLVLRLYGVLGRRDGHDGSGYRDLFGQDQHDENRREEDNIVQFGNRDQADGREPDAFIPGFDQQESPAVDLDDITEDNPLQAGIAQVRRQDRNFNEEDFLVGARVAFEMILNAYASGDTDTLRNLLSNEVYSNFAKAIQDREQAGHIMEDTLVGISKSEIVEAYLENNNAHITVKFVSEQVNVVKDENGDVVEGNANQVLNVTDFWTFSRDVKSDNPNWELVATRSLD